MANRVLNLYSHQFYTNDYGVINSSHDAVRADAESTLLAEVLPQVNLNYLAMTPMELVYGSYIYRSNLTAENPQCFGECTPMTPYVFSVIIMLIYF